jgi:hypothetical protein
MPPAAPPAKPAGSQKKLFGLPRNTVIIGGVVFAVALGWFLWKRHTAKPAAAACSSCTTCTSSTALSTIEQELQELLNDQQGAGSGGGSSGSGGCSGGSTGTGGGGTGTTTGSGTGTTTATCSGSASSSTCAACTSTTTTSAPPTPAPAWSYPAPTGLAVSQITNTGYYLKWNAVKGPSGQTPASYTIATYNQSGTEVNSHDTVPGSTQTSEYGKGGKGLPKGTYHSNVWANGGPKAPPHASTSDITLKG